MPRPAWSMAGQAPPFGQSSPLKPLISDRRSQTLAPMLSLPLTLSGRGDFYFAVPLNGRTP
ncbi:MAG: hypothetical protein CL917_03865 [Deltaproteobacteria bacterium]|nr:hypothetical protein [Deltaproteobacteria bacterium]